MPDRKFYATLEVRMKVRANDESEAKGRIAMSVAEMEGDSITSGGYVDVQGMDIIAITEE